MSKLRKVTGLLSRTRASGEQSPIRVVLQQGDVLISKAMCNVSTNVFLTILVRSVESLSSEDLAQIYMKSLSGSV